MERVGKIPTCAQGVILLYSYIYDDGETVKRDCEIACCSSYMVFGNSKSVDDDQDFNARTLFTENSNNDGEI